MAEIQSKALHKVRLARSAGCTEWSIELFYTFPGKPRWKRKEIFRGSERMARRRAHKLWSDDQTARDMAAIPHNQQVGRIIRPNPSTNETT